MTLVQRAHGWDETDTFALMARRRDRRAQLALAAYAFDHLGMSSSSKS
jgi:hypothetical protein